MSIEATFMSPFALGVIEVFKIQCSLAVSVESSRRMKIDERVAGDLRGVIEVRSGDFKGMMILDLPTATFIAVLAKMFGETYAEITPELRDGAGELSNMIFGHAKRVLNERGHHLQMARPVVMTGGDRPKDVPVNRFSIAFKSEIGPFFLELWEMA